MVTSERRTLTKKEMVEIRKKLPLQEGFKAVFDGWVYRVMAVSKDGRTVLQPLGFVNRENGDRESNG